MFYQITNNDKNSASKSGMFCDSFYQIYIKQISFTI